MTSVPAPRVVPASAPRDGRRAWRPSWRWLRGPAGIHYLALAVAFVGFAVVSTRGWFFYDDFAFLVPSQQSGIWAPHVGHWSTVPFTLFLVLRDIFGMGSYLPFALLVIVAQLLFAHLMWRFLLRVGVLPPISTALSLLLIFFGAGSENVLWAFQVGFVGAMAFGMLVVLILLRATLRPLDVGLIILFSVLALASSGTSLPLLAIAALIGWQRHGFLRTVAILAGPAAIYGVWFGLSGRFAPPAGRAEGFGQVLTGVPTYAISMLTDGLGRAFPIAVLGPILFAATAIWGVLSYRGASWRRRPAYILFLAAPLFALFTGYSRLNLGLETATSSRYLFFAIPMMLPLMALGLTSLVRRLNLRVSAVVVLIAILVIYNFGGMVSSVLERQARADSARERLSAALALVHDYPDASPSLRPAAQWAPDVTLADAEAFQKNGWFSKGPYDEAAELTERGALGLEARSASAPAPAVARGCTTLASAAPPTTIDGDDMLVRASAPLTLRVALERGKAIGDATGVTLHSGWNEVDLSGPAVAADFVIDAASSGLTVCSTTSGPTAGP